jgi:hypothetical protein
MTKPKMIAEPGRTRHGLSVVKKRIGLYGLNAVDRRFAASRALMAWRTELINALGGEALITPQQTALVDIAVRSKLYCDHVDAFLLEQPSLINRKKKVALPILLQRFTMSAQLERTLLALGLERVPVPVKPINAQLIEEARAELRRLATPEAKPKGDDDGNNEPEPDKIA